MNITVKRRIRYSYGVNSGVREGNASFDELQRQVESESCGLVQVDRREECLVYQTEWRDLIDDVIDHLTYDPERDK